MSIRAMIVDDSSFTRTMIKNILNENGVLQVIEAEDGKEAILKYKEENPDIVFLDIMIPHEDGIKVLENIKKINKNAKVVICTSINDDDVFNEAKNMGAMGFVTKPFRTNEIKKFLDKI